MESTGVKFRIQVSPATADALVAGGKGNWLKERDDKVLAKGKGEMQTYFVEINDSKSSSTGTGTDGQADDNSR